MIDRLIKSSIAKTKKSILLLGPRQVGKSTLMHSLKPDLTINLARENEFLLYSSNVNLFFDQVANSQLELIFIDEIQRIPGMLNTIQALIDENKNRRKLKFLISGSSARKLRRGQANLLPGRVFSYELAGLSAREINYKFDIDRCLKFGFLPEPFTEGSNHECEKLLSSYAAIYLKEEIQAEALLRNIQGFARFLLQLAATAGHILDFSKVSTKAKVSRTSSVRFVEILEDTLIAHRIYSFNQDSSADTVKHPKLYFFDVGVLNGLLNNFNISADRKGLLFEHLIYSQIRNSAFAHDKITQIQFFRTRHGVEVDFIITIEDTTWAIEVKSGDVIDSDLNNLRIFHKYFPHIKNRILVTPRTKTYRSDGILICDCATMLKEIGF